MDSGENPVIDYVGIKDIDDDIFKCKLFYSHAWDVNVSPQNIDGQIAKMAYRVLALRCERCGREKYEYINRRGERIAKPYYKNPVGYPKTHRLSGDELRVEMLRRAILVQTYNGRKNDNRRISTRRNQDTN